MTTKTDDQQRAAFKTWKKDYALTLEPNYSADTEHDCKEAFSAGWAAAIALDRQQRGEPSGHAYRYSHHDGGTVIRFNNGGEVNGSRPIESVPYWFAPQPAEPVKVPSGAELLAALRHAKVALEPYAKEGKIVPGMVLNEIRALLSRYGQPGQLAAPAANQAAVDAKALATAQEIALMWGHDRSQFVSRIQVAVLDAMRWAQPTASAEPAFFINPKIIDPATNKIAGHVKEALTWQGRALGAWSTPVFLAPVAAQPSVPTVCDGKEQYAFEAWAKSQRMDMSEHPRHYLFLHEKTDAARQGWKAAIEYCAAAPTPPAADQEK